MYKAYKHNPPHLFLPGRLYFITGATYKKTDFLAPAATKKIFLEQLFFYAHKFGWELRFWSVLNNHYHLIAQAPGETCSLSKLIHDLHSFSAKGINAKNRAKGARVWWNYWDSCLTYERSYFARINYIHWNCVKHGLAKSPVAYEFSSYPLYLEKNAGEMKEIETRYPWDKIEVMDDF